MAHPAGAAAAHRRPSRHAQRNVRLVGYVITAVLDLEKGHVGLETRQPISLPQSAGRGGVLTRTIMETMIVVGVRTLGRAIALHFAAEGWQVICAARTRDDVERLAAEVDAAGGRGTGVVCDLQDVASLQALARDRPRIDLCIAAQTAGGRFGSKPLLDIDDEELDRGFASYVRGTWNLLKAVGPKLLAQGAGTFVQVGTSSGVRTKEGFAALGACQHGLRALVQVAAREWRPQGVHAAYLPVDGAIESERTKAWVARSGPERAIPQVEIARACMYLHRQDHRAWTHELVLRPYGGEWTAPT
jgi:NAD(P)-dependent dehydrogenase (short-subunit alcohol dehydrogenase family)